jgi:hypothetical protein
MRTRFFAFLVGAFSIIAGSSAQAAPPRMYFHGSQTDPAGNAAFTGGTATFDANAPTGAAPVTQTGTPLANNDFAGNFLAAFWSGPYTGTLNGNLSFDWWWYTTNPKGVALGEVLEVSVFADPDFSTNTGTLIGRSLVALNGVTTAPQEFTGVVAVSGAVGSTLLIQVVPQFVDAGLGVFVAYDSTLTPSSFTYADAPAPPVPVPAPKASGLPPRFSILQPTQAQLAAGTGNPSSSEPSIGVDWVTGKAFYQAILETLRVTFADDCTTSPSSVWEDTASAITSTESFDPILYTDSKLGRTFVSQLLLPTSALAFTDNDGNSWTPSQGAGIGAGYDHQTLGGGPFHAPLPPGAVYQDAVYYCSQEVAEASCALSIDGGLTFGPAVPIYQTTDCGGLHGHLQVGPDGTAYVPNKACGTGQGLVVSQDNGATWTVNLLPGSHPAGSDPSVAIDKAGRLYFAYADNNNHLVVAASDDHGATWKNQYDVGAAYGLVNVVFAAAVAGDAGRAAVAFHGTTTKGDLTGATFPGVWHLYVAATYDGGAHWITNDVTPNDPVQRGCIWLGGGSNICRNLLDFFGATVDAQGRILVGYADGCHGACTQAPATATGNGYTARAAIARQSGGRRMFAAFDPAEPAVPSAPALTVTRNGSVAHLTWSEGNDGGSTVTGYKVYRGTASGHETLLASVGTATKYDDATTDASKTYYYTVVAANSLGSSCGSNEQASAPAGGSCTLPGVAVVTDAAGDQKGAPLNTALDVRSVSIAEPYQSDGSKKLAFTMKVADLTTLPPLARWAVFWNSPFAPDGQFYVSMLTAQSGAPSFEYGTVAVTSAVLTAVGQFTPVGAPDAASGFAPDGTITIVIANDLVGGPRAGDLLGGVIGRTFLGGDQAATSSRVAIDTTDALAEPYALIGNGACAPAVTTCLEDDASQIAYSNGWHLVSSSSASAGHFRLNANKGTASLTFSVPPGQFGTVQYFYATSTKGGSATVAIDGVAQGTISYAGSSGTMQAPVFGASATYRGLAPGSHTLTIQGTGGVLYVDKFCLTSSASNAQPSSGPGATATSTASILAGQQSLSSLTLPAGTQAISVVVSSTPGIPVTLALLNATGATLQTVSSSSGVLVLEQPASAGVVLVKLVDTGAAPIGVWMAATPLVGR